MGVLSDTDYKVGDKIVELGQVFKVFKIKKIEASDGCLIKTLFFKPLFVDDHTANYVCSIPVENIPMTQIRKPMSKKELNFLVKKIRNSKICEEFSNVDKAKELLCSSDPFDLVKILKCYWKLQCEEENFTKRKKDVFLSALNGIAEEFAAVTNMTLDKAKMRIFAALESQ